MNTRKWLGYSLISIIFLCLTSCSAINQSPTETPSLQTPAPALEANTVSASGQVVPQKWVNLSFSSGGEDLQILVTVGDKVQEGQLLAHLDDTEQQIQLDQAKQALSELTSAEAIANAKLAVTTAETNVINAQTALNNEQYWKNDALIQNYYANYVIAKDNLDKAQSDYDSLTVGPYINNANEANAYNKLYTAKKAYDTAFYYYSLYSQKPTQRQMDEAQANLDLAKARLANAQAYLNKLTTGDVPANTSGNAFQQLRQAQRNVAEAEKNLKATKLYSPFSGSIVEVNGHKGEIFSPGLPLIVLADFTTLQVQTKDMSEVDAGRVHVSDTAKVSFDALPDVNVTGKVTQIALKNSTGSGVYYTVTIALDKIPEDLRWGMSAFVVIKVK
jgi:multidrug efflux pump subunit AcrA (membrane-fusion protein)